MATLTGSRASADFPVFQPLGTGYLCAAYGSYDMAANPTAADILQICRLPAGATVLDGFVRMEDLDSNATETLDIDVGWAANGAESADPDGFGNFGVQTGDALVGYLPEGGTRLPFHGVLKDGVVSFTRETIVTVTWTAVAATFAAGTITVVVYYVVPA
jgi:hypothetical protein